MMQVERRWGGFILVSWMLSASGCGGSAGPAKSAYQDPHPLPADTLTVAAAEIGTHGGRFVIGATAAPKTFNGIMANETSSTDISQLIFTTLADYDNANQQDVPMLAKSWDVSPDGLTWTWHLRRGVRFSDGHLITADDVLFSFAVAYDEKLHPSIQDLLKPGGKALEVTAPDSYTVVTRAAAPYALMIPAIGSLRIMPKHMLEAAFRSGNFASAYNTSTAPDSLVVSGPWRVQQFVAGEKTTLTRNPHSFRVDARGQRLPYLDALVFLIVPDQEAATLKFQAGELDGLDNVKPEDYQGYADRAEAEDFTLFDLGPSLNTNFFWFNLNTIKEPKPGKRVGQPYADPVKYAWFRQKEFRRAVSMALDREAIIRSVLFGEAVKNWSQSTAANKQWYAADLVGADYNPDEARRLLAGLGFKDGDGDGYLEDASGHPVTFTIKTNGDNKVRMQMCSFIKDDLAKVGVKAVPTGVEFNTLIVNLRENFQYDAILLGLQSGVPPDPGMGQNVWRSSGLTHYWNIRQKAPESAAEAEIDRLMDRNVGTIDHNERQKTWRDIQRIVNEENWVVWLPTVLTKIPIRNRFGNLQPVIIPHRILWNIDRVFVKARARA